MAYKLNDIFGAIKPGQNERSNMLKNIIEKAPKQKTGGFAVKSLMPLIAASLILAVGTGVAVAYLGGRNDSPWSGETPEETFGAEYEEADTSETPYYTYETYYTEETVVNYSPDDLSPLELLGGYHTEHTEWGDVIVLNNSFDMTFNPDLYRKYFFGKWESAPYEDGTRLVKILDESDECNIPPTFFGAAAVIDNVIVTRVTSGGVMYMFWIDMDKPDVMYHTEERFENGIKVYRKIGEPNPPSDKYISDLMIKEMLLEYSDGDEEFNELYGLIYNIDTTVEDGKLFHTDDHIFNSAKTLISRDENSLTFKADIPVLRGMGVNDVETAAYTVYKKDGVWKRDIISYEISPIAYETQLPPDYIGFVCPVEKYVGVTDFDGFGVNYKSFVGEDVLAGQAGEVISIEEVSTSANEKIKVSKYITIRHYNGMMSRYGNVDKVFVSAGDAVDVGQAIATVGEDALRFELMDFDDTFLNPFDGWIPKG